MRATSTPPPKKHCRSGAKQTPALSRTLRCARFPASCARVSAPAASSAGAASAEAAGVATGPVGSFGTCGAPVCTSWAAAGSSERRSQGPGAGCAAWAPPSAPPQGTLCRPPSEASMVAGQDHAAPRMVYRLESTVPPVLLTKATQLQLTSSPATASTQRHPPAAANTRASNRHATQRAATAAAVCLLLPSSPDPAHYLAGIYFYPLAEPEGERRVSRERVRGKLIARAKARAGLVSPPQKRREGTLVSFFRRSDVEEASAEKELFFFGKIWLYM